MPAPALPFPRGNRQTVRYHRRYVDALGRPMTGTVTVTRRVAHAQGEEIVVPSAAAVALVDGHLNVMLTPGDYELAAQLRTAENVGVVHKIEVTVEAPA